MVNDATILAFRKRTSCGSKLIILHLAESQWEGIRKVLFGLGDKNMNLEILVDEIISEAKSCANRVVIIHGKYNYGKSTIIRRLFDEYQYVPKIFQSGCNPVYRNIATANLVSKIKMISELSSKKIILFLDEFDDDISLRTILCNDDIVDKAFICTNCDIVVPYLGDYAMIDLVERYSKADDYMLTQGISPGEFLCKGKQSFDNDGVVKKKASIHSMTIAYDGKYREISTIFYQKGQ